jgi:hypothetical protein
MRQTAGFIAETKPKMVKILANHHILPLFNFRTPRRRLRPAAGDIRLAIQEASGYDDGGR